MWGLWGCVVGGLGAQSGGQLASMEVQAVVRWGGRDMRLHTQGMWCAAFSGLDAGLD